MQSYATHCNMRSFDDGMRNKRFIDGVNNYLKGSLVVGTYGNKVTFRCAYQF